MRGAELSGTEMRGEAECINIHAGRSPQGRKAMRGV